MKKKVLLASSLGNAFEFFDFILYGAFIDIIASNFFPSQNKTVSLLMSLGVFGVGLIMRPFGALVFGYFGDLIGRKRTLSVSMLLMGIPTFIIGILPNYEQIGIASSFIIIIGRLIQGICAGGEYNGAAIFAIEHNKEHPGLIGGIITASCVLGALMATLSRSLIDFPDAPEWAWRIPFLSGIFISVIGYYVRRNLTDSFIFSNAFSKKSIPILKSILSRKSACLLSFSFGALNGALSYTLFVFLNIYLSRYLNFPLADAIRINLFGLFAFMLGSPLLGFLYDKLPNHLFIKYVPHVLFFSMIPIFWLISSPISILSILGQIAFGISAASVAGTGHAAMQNLFPIKERYSGISFFFSLGIGIFGSITPLLFVEAIEMHKESLYFPAFFLMSLSVLLYGAYATIMSLKPLHPKNGSLNE